MPSHADAFAAARDIADGTAEQTGGWFWLDGSAAPAGETRTSYLGRASEIVFAAPGRERDFLQLLRDRSQASASAAAAVSLSAAQRAASDGSAEGSLQRFTSGWVVALGYEFGVGLLGMQPAVDTEAPAFALRVDEVVAIHHEDNAQQDEPSQALTSATARPLWRSSDSAYLHQVEECREAIHRGDAYVLCLTDTAEFRAPHVIDPLGLYEALGAGGSRAATRGGVIAAPGRTLVSASPERFLSVQGQHVATHPIKGTRRRGTDATEDQQLAEELAGDPKERAENLMIVDLMRNDLSQVCMSGSVRVDRFLDIETHPRVHQLVSTVSGQLEAGRDVYDAIAACFPGGSMTGAPKRSAIATLAALEAGPRGLYSGCFGWIDDSGDAELAMTIRGVELRVDPLAKSTRVLIGAGGGVTADSVPERELAERDLKAAGMLAAIARA